MSYLFYPKNVPTIERAMRILLGLALIGFVVFNQSAVPLPLVIIVLGSALFVIVTGFVGWCPACALLGRKLKSTRRAE